MHKLPIQIRFNDVDQMGHVNNAVIMEYFDLGKSAFFTDAGIPPEQGDFTVMIVHFEVDFTSQIRYHDKISVTTAVKRIGHKSISVEQHILNDMSGADCAVCRTVMAGYRRSTHSSEAIPDDLKAKLLAE